MPGERKVDRMRSDLINDVLKAKAAVLRQAIDVVGPLLGSLCEPIRAEGLHRLGPDGAEVEEHRVELELNGARVKGLHIAGDAGPRKDLPDAEGGLFHGWGLWLLSDARLVELRFLGHWSLLEESASGWSATPEVLGPDAAARHWSVEGIIGRLQEAVSRQLPGALVALKSPAQIFERTLELLDAG